MEAEHLREVITSMLKALEDAELALRAAKTRLGLMLDDVAELERLLADDRRARGNGGDEP